jgi:uncharacterized protein YbjT (DUF2867 family)
MGSILITGLTGNVGREVANSLKQREVGFVCGVRNIDKAQKSVRRSIQIYNVGLQQSGNL